MFSIKINNLKEFVNAFKAIKDIAKCETGKGEIKLIAEEGGFFVQSSESGSYFVSQQIIDCVVITEGHCFVNTDQLNSLLDCVNQSGLTSIKITVEDKEIVVDGALLGEIRVPLPSNQQPWKRSPLARKDIEWELIAEGEDLLKKILTRLKDFHSKNYVKISVEEDSCFLTISACNETGTVYAKSLIKIDNPSKYTHSFIVNNQLINNFLKVDKGELRLYINKNSEGSLDLDAENLMYKFEYPASGEFKCYSNFKAPMGLKLYEKHYLNTPDICTIKINSSDFINAVNWQQFQLDTSGSLFISYNKDNKNIVISKDKEIKEDCSNIPIIEETGSWENNFYSVISVNKIAKILNRNLEITLKLVKFDIQGSPLYILFFEEEGDNGLNIGMNFSEQVF